MVQGDKTMKKINKFKALRIFNGLTQQDTSKVMEMSQGMISRIENMEDKKCDKYFLKLFARLERLLLRGEIERMYDSEGHSITIYRR